MHTRRRFLAESSATWLIALSAPVALISCDDVGESGEGGERPEPVELDLSNVQLLPGVPLRATRQRAIELLDTRFNILYDDAHVVRAELVDVTDGLQTDDTDEFALLFRTSWEPRLTEAMYQFEHAQLGRFPLYLRPAESSDGAHHYAVTVNRLKQLPAE